MKFPSKCYLFEFLYIFYRVFNQTADIPLISSSCPIMMLFSLSSHFCSWIHSFSLHTFFLFVETCEQKRFFSILIIYQLIQFHTSIIELYCAYVPRQQNGKRERYKFMYGNIYVWRVIKTRKSAIHYFFFNKKKRSWKIGSLNGTFNNNNTKL